MCRFCVAVLFVTALIEGTGCTPPVPTSAPAASVKGVVNVDGKPLPTGEVHFVMSAVPPKVLEVKNGAFAGEAAIGQNKVEVMIYAEGPPVEKYGGARSKQVVTPQKYWGVNTTLTASVKANEPNEFTFNITAK